MFLSISEYFFHIQSGLRNGTNLTPPSGGFGYHISMFTAPMHMFSPLLVSIRCLKIRKDPKLPLLVEELAEGVSGLRAL